MYFQIHKEILVFSKATQAGLLSFSQIRKIRWKIAFFFKYKSRLQFQIVPNSLKICEGEIVRIVFQAWDDCTRKKWWTQFKIKLPAV